MARKIIWLDPEGNRILDIKNYKPPKKKLIKEDVTYGDIIRNNVDIFDNKTYSKEVTLIKKFFIKNPVETSLRSALLIDYLYNHNSEEGRKFFYDKLASYRLKTDKKRFLASMLDVFEPLYIITQFYRHYALEKLQKEGICMVEKLIDKYKAEKAVVRMYNGLYRVYVDGGWVKRDEGLWFTEE